MSEKQEDYITDAEEMLGAGYEVQQPAPYRIEGREPTIFRVAKDKKNPYVMIDRRPVDNKKLSFKAKGILTYLMSRPDGWEVSVTDLVNHSTDGEDSIRSGLRELKDAGHMRYIQKRVKGRITQMVIEVYEVPVTQPQAGFPHLAKPDVAKPDVDNPTQVLSTSSSKKLSILDDTQIEKIQASADKKVNAILEQELNAPVHKKWTHREKFSFNTDILALADKCVERFGNPAKREISLWNQEIGGWVDFGCRSEDWARAEEIVSSFTTPVLSITGMTKAIKAARMERKSRPAPVQPDNVYKPPEGNYVPRPKDLPGPKFS